MRIAMIHSPFEARSGGERQILSLAIELQNRGNEVEIFTNSLNNETYPEYFDKVKINVIPYPLTRFLPQDWIPYMIVPKQKQKLETQIPTSNNSIRRMQRIRKKVFGFYYLNHLPYMIEMGRKIPKKFDIINNHNFITNWAGYIAKSRLRVPLVWMCNEPHYWFFAKDTSRFRNINWPIFEVLDKTTVNYIDRIMVLSHVSEDYVRKAYGKSSTIVRTGVDIELFHSAKGEKLRKKLNLEKSFVLLFVGGSVYARRSDLVRALAILSKKHENVKLIIDTYREREMLTKLASELKLNDKVLLLDSKTTLELSEVYAACDAFIYPSSASPWGLVVTEAMAAAKPVIVSKQVGTSEIIKNKVNGIIIEDATPNEIAEKIEMLMADPALCRKLGENAYEYVKMNLSWEKYAERVEKVFKETLTQSVTC